jgi:flagellin-specific chaperone FliS
MSSDDSAFAYHQTTAFGASALGQVIALYDTMLRDFDRAMAAIGAGQIEKRVNALNRALIVVVNCRESWTTNAEARPPGTSATLAPSLGP